MRSLVHGSVKVGTKPTLVCHAGPGAECVLVQNVSSAAVFVGSADVATSGTRRGVVINPGECQSIPIYEPDASEVYAVAAKADSAEVVFLTY